MERQDAVSAWRYVAAGFALGVAVGLLIAPEAVRYRKALARMEKEPPRGPSLASRALSWMPLRVKLAGAYGALVGAGRKAYHLAAENRHAAG